MKLYWCFLGFCLAVNTTFAQQIKPYLAVVKTTGATYKGVLQKVDSNYLVLDCDTGFAKVDAKSIKAIKVKVVKTPYQPKTYLRYSWNLEEYNLYRDGKWYNKNGIAEPSLGDHIVGEVGTGVINGLTNAFAIPIKAINSSIAKYKVKNELTLTQQQSLKYFSIDYQRSPQSLLDLKRLKVN